MHFAALFFVVFVGCVGSNAMPTEECKLSDWGPWGECKTTSIGAKGNAPFSFSLEATETADRGRAMMKIAVEEKNRIAEERRQCQADKSCPEFNPRPTVMKETKCVNGMSGEYPCRNIDMLSHVSIEDLGYTKDMQEELADPNVRGNDIWGWTDPETGREYAVVCLSAGTSFVDVTEATAPKVLAYLPGTTAPSKWRDAKVVYNTAYIVSEAADHGLQVFDLERLRHMTSFSYVEPDNTYMLFGNAHNIVSNEETGYVFVVGATDKKYEYSCQGGLHFINVRDRLNPAFSGCFPDDGYVHDAQCVIYTGPHVEYQGKEICFCFNEDTLTLVDVTNKEKSYVVSKSGYSTAMYTHQGWLTEDMTIVLLDDELDEKKGVSPVDDELGHTVTYNWDVTNLEKPELKSHYISSEIAIDHNQYVLGDLTYQSNYGAGLRILHIDQPTYGLKEVAYFDCLPTSSGTPQFEGTWSNFPYFKSGNVILNSIEYGLFVLRPDHTAIRNAIKQEKAHKEQTRTRTIQFATAHASCAGLVQPRECGQEVNTVAEATP